MPESAWPIFSTMPAPRCCWPMRPDAQRSATPPSTPSRWRVRPTTTPGRRKTRTAPLPRTISPTSFTPPAPPASRKA
ncbi:hypothetical protein EJP617_D020 (plasmid) [Erwinia sp. Ejp617]|nr:hypothetical protein EJP617_D020 [Erwinia sp. Ejp617]